MRGEVAEMQQSNREEEAKPKEEEGSTEAKRGAKKKCKEGLITCCCGSHQCRENPRQRRKDCREFLLVLGGRENRNKEERGEGGELAIQQSTEKERGVRAKTTNTEGKAIEENAV